MRVSPGTEGIGLTCSAGNATGRALTLAAKANGVGQDIADRQVWARPKPASARHDSRWAATVAVDDASHALASGNRDRLIGLVFLQLERTHEPLKQLLMPDGNGCRTAADWSAARKT